MNIELKTGAGKEVIQELNKTYVFLREEVMKDELLLAKEAIEKFIENGSTNLYH